MKIKGWCRQINNIENCVADSTDPSKVQSERNFLGSTMNILVSVQEQFLDMMEDSEQRVLHKINLRCGNMSTQMH